MTSQYEPLRALLQSWRDQLPYKGSQWEERHDHIKECADELEGALDEMDEDAHLVQNDGRDAVRYRYLAKHARQDTSYDVFGKGGHWSIDIHSDDNFLTFGQAIDAAMESAQ
jgi:hypothetical protein